MRSLSTRFPFAREVSGGLRARSREGEKGFQCGNEPPALVSLYAVARNKLAKQLVLKACSVVQANQPANVAEREA